MDIKLKIAAALSTLFLASRALEHIPTNSTLFETSIDPNCTRKLGDGGTITVYYDEGTELINMRVNIPDNTFAGFGWGATMTNTELVVFSANGDSSAVTTYYGTGNLKPEALPSLQSCYTWQRIMTSSDIELVATRPLDCNVPESYVI